MKTSYLVLEFNGCSTTIELLNTPVVEKWLLTFNANKQNNLYDYKPENWTAFIHEHHLESDIHPLYGYRKSDIVDEINKSIEKANSQISGVKFPYHAFEGMSWEQTNNIHRCFTLSVTTGTNWQHGFDENQLLEFKKIHYSTPFKIGDLIKEHQYTITGDYRTFNDAVHEINDWVHKYESFYVNDNVVSLKDTLGTVGEYLSLEWDNFNHNHAPLPAARARTSYEDLLKSFPDNYFDYNVFMGKSIKGKDYEFAFSQFDNPLEFDITNLDGINGSLRLHYNNNFKSIYQNSIYADWLNTLNLPPQMYLPVPVGKIVDTTCDFTEFKPNYSIEETWSNGSIKPLPPFNSVNSYIIEK